MAANSPYFAAEDQTDEDFFDKLVDDDFVAQPELTVRSLSNLSLNDVGAPLGDPELISQAEDYREKDVSFGQESIVEKEQAGGCTESTVEVDSKGDGSKGTSVKVVQWSAFHVEPQQLDAGGFGFDSDFLTENAHMSTNKQQENAGVTSCLSEQPVLGSSTFVDSSEQKDAQFCGSASEQGSQDWENLYPGWKYDYTTGQWYQVDGYDTSVDGIQSDVHAYGVGSGSAAQSSDKAHALSVGFVSDSSSMSYLQQTSHSVSGAIAEECTTGSIANWNQDSQGSMQYPPNMLFDPQYPGWYYDTNTQQWYTLDSYTQSAAQNTVITLQDHFNRDANKSADSIAQQSYSLYKEPSQFEQQTVQNQGHNFGGDWSVSTNNHAQRDWNTSASNFAQENMWQTEAVNESNNAAGFYANQQSRSFYGSAGNMGSQMDQHIGFKPAEPVLSHRYAGNSSLTRFQGFAHKETSSSGNTGSQMDQHVGFKPVEPVLNHGHGSNSALIGFQGFAPEETSSAKNTGSQIDQHVGFKPTEPVLNHGYGSNGSLTGFQGFVPTETMYQFNQPKVEQNIQSNSIHSSYGHQNSINYSQSMFQGGRASYSQFYHASSEGRSSAGRPPHALVTFGFGGKIIIMKDDSSLGAKLDYGSQGTASGTVSILNLMDVVINKSDGSSIISNDSCSYFDPLCQQSFPGPLVGGNTAAKDVNKWVDERIMNCEPSSMDFHKQELLKLLFSLLKISCQHYGKFRSPFGSDLPLEETDGPEAAVTKLFASARKNGPQLGDYGYVTHCVKNLPSEGQIRATAMEVQNLLVSGRRSKALECAQDGHLWGPALVLAAQLGEKFYVETVKKMAQQQFISGSPLRTLCLLIAGQPAEVFSTDSSTSSLASANAYQQPAQVLNNSMLDDWEENLAIITANRTKDDELVIIHLGDCLWKEREEIISAHTCYLIAEANFESYSDSARLCLIGADHWKCPRTYASPEAIQRTELYEYSKVLGNSQFILLPFQPYKLIYASMLAEVGKVSDSLRYCQASLKTLKNSGRAPEIEMWKSLFSSLEERLRTHQQGGYGTNLAPAKLVGKFFTSIDRSIHRMIGAPPPPLPPLPHDNATGKESYSTVPKVASSQSTMAMSSLIPSASVEAISEWTGDSNRKAMHNRSISEPDFGRSPKQASSKDSSSSLDSQSKSSVPGGPSRFGYLGSQLLRKTMGWVSRSRPDHQAKLGERNKFYYDEKLKRWVEEGAEPPAEEAALPPPPTTASFQNGTADYYINNAFKNQNDSADGGRETKPPCTSEQSSCTPPIPPSTNQFSARARIGVRSRYVDTFNAGGGSITNSFQSPSIPSVKPAVPANFFIPAAAAASDDQPVDEPQEHIQEPAPAGELSTSVASESLFTSPSTSSATSMQRFPSMDNIVPFGNKQVGTTSQNANGSLSSRTRAASWSGAYTMNALGDGLNGSPLVPHNPSKLQTSNSSLQLNSGWLGDDLHEVEL